MNLTCSETTCNPIPKYNPSSTREEDLQEELRLERKRIAVRRLSAEIRENCELFKQEGGFTEKEAFKIAMVLLQKGGFY